ncbi:hypothetical protein [Chryseobacterium sp. MP_3.2]|uniref:hypothetical protein n=1 Tax=Chryseobacterium sp. MP_3.2 TaxID=3071712 RepID=UPI002E02C356|nr:aspartate racemase [Chryseobacterium sp. MP_3.2]
MNVEQPVKGILGLGFESTHYYVKEIQKKFKEDNSEFSTYPYLMYQIDCQEINPFLPNQFEILIPKLQELINHIRSIGIKKLLVPNITLHETLDQVNLPLEIFHPVQLGIDYLKEKSIIEVFIFGTNYTMNSAYLRIRFLEKGIILKLPEKDDQDWIDNFRKTVFNKAETPEEISVFQSLIKTYASKNPVMIACTELSLYSLKEVNICIDLAHLQIEAFLKS